MRPFGVSSLRSRLIILVLSALVPALGLMLYCSAVHRRIERSEVGRDTLLLVKMAEANHRGLLEGARQLLMTLAHLPEVRSLDGEACRRLFAHLLKHSPAHVDISVTDARGLTFASAGSAPPGRDLAEAALPVGGQVLEGRPLIRFENGCRNKKGSYRRVPQTTIQVRSLVA